MLLGVEVKEQIDMFMIRRRFLVLIPGGRRYGCRAQIPHKFTPTPP